ncbi:MFS transporter [Devosia rhodophyticola]|uniref:MFS transporter n=1 Tax=Devosia rhodophyticola TaxID=3026423 RepID=A0ABY7YYU8_9HYPH|nr:MFS transporter [Devosia rhodophyticola]WDR06190.1 MFS transporter [Devosia rhodophyticola]
MSDAQHLAPNALPVEQTDYDKMRRLPFLFISSTLTGAAAMTLVGAPMTLFASEMGLEADRIGLLGGIMPFFQLLGIAFLPLIMRFGCRRVASTALTVRYLFLLLFLIAPTFYGAPDTVFWLMFTAMALFSLSRTIAEAAYVPWSQEFMPRVVRGVIMGRLAIAGLPIALGVSFAIKLWLDSRVGLDRFVPVFGIGIIVGLIGALSLIGLGGGKPNPQGARGMAAMANLKAPLRDHNFLIFLFSSGTQYLIVTVMGVFLLLFFKLRLSLASGELIFLSTLIPVGAAIGSLATGWIVDRYGSRGIRITLQVCQVFLLLSFPLMSPELPGVTIIAALMFSAFGFLAYGSITAGNVYLLNYVPPANKESYTALSYSVDGIVGGSATFGAGFLVFWLEQSKPQVLGFTLGSYETLFVLCALLLSASLVAFAFLREEGGTGVKDFISQFSTGNSLQALWGVHRYGHLTSEERRRELTYRFGGTRSALAKEELFEALRDPSFDVRYEAIQALGHLPRNARVVTELENMLRYHGLVELQYAALTALGRLRSVTSHNQISEFLNDPNPILRARATRSLGEIRDDASLPLIRAQLEDDPELDCRLAAASALGKLGDRESVEPLLRFYCELVRDDVDIAGEPRSKVVLLAVSKILQCEESFSQDWRREEKFIGFRLPNLLNRIADTLRRLSNEEAQNHRKLLAKVAAELGGGDTLTAFRALQDLRAYVANSKHPNSTMVLSVMDATREIKAPHRALLVLLCIVMRPVLKHRLRD